jgi:hypothetical protein
MSEEWDQPPNWKGEKRKKSDELCQRGIFRHMMSPNQRKFHELLDRPDVFEAALFCSRKFGKSFSALLYEMELCLHNKGFLARHVFPELKQAKDTMFKIYDELKSLVPKSVLPDLIKSEASFYFPQTGSYIMLGGTKPENIESSRGPKAHHLALDEVAAFDANNYVYALYSVLFPQLSTTAGKTPHYTTPPESPQHPWITTHYPKFQQKGTLLTFNFDQNDVLTQQAKDTILERYTIGSYTNPRENPSFRREYLCELIANVDRRVVPEFNREDHVYTGDPYAPLKDDRGEQYTDVVAYVSGDHGVVDLTVLHLGVVDWRKGVFYFVKEIVLRGKNEAYLSNFAANIRDIQAEAARISEEQVTRIDCFESVRISLLKDHGISASLPAKHNLEGAIGVLRSSLADGKVKIHESCKQLITDLEFSLWKSSESDTRKIERTDMTAHFDAGMSAVYGIRTANFTRRPSSNKGIILGRKK